MSERQLIDIRKTNGAVLKCLGGISAEKEEAALERLTGNHLLSQKLSTNGKRLNSGDLRTALSYVTEFPSHVISLCLLIASF